MPFRIAFPNHKGGDLRPQGADGDGEQALAERSSMIAVIEQNAQPESSSGNVSKAFQAGKVPGVQSGRRLHFDGKAIARCVFDDDVDLHLVLVPVVEKAQRLVHMVERSGREWDTLKPIVYQLRFGSPEVLESSEADRRP